MTYPLQTLHDKVEAGEVLQAYEASDIWPTYYDKEAGRNVLIWLDACKASQGSLDAAKALHDAVLPEWHAQIETDGEVTISSFTTNEYGFSVVDTEITVQENDMARAWLLAILRALINSQPKLGDTNVH